MTIFAPSLNVIWLPCRARVAIRGPRDKLKEIGYRLLRSKKNYEGLVGIACLALAYYHRAAIYAENELSRSPPTLRGPFPSFDTYLTHALPSSSALPDEAKNSRWFDWLLAEPLAAPGSLTVAGDWRPDAAWREYRAALTAGFVGKAPDDARRAHMEQQRRDSREESDRWDRERDRQQVLRPSQPSDPMFDLPLPWDT